MAKSTQKLESPVFALTLDTGHNHCSGYADEGWAEINVPGHIQLQGYGKPQYINVAYPWEGVEQLLPPEIPSEYNPVGSYRTHFDLPDGFLGKELRLTFHRVENLRKL